MGFLFSQLWAAVDQSEYLASAFCRVNYLVCSSVPRAQNLRFKQRMSFGVVLMAVRPCCCWWVGGWTEVNGGPPVDVVYDEFKQMARVHWETSIQREAQLPKSLVINWNTRPNGLFDQLVNVSAYNNLHSCCCWIGQVVGPCFTRPF